MRCPNTFATCSSLLTRRDSTTRMRLTKSGASINSRQNRARSTISSRTSVVAVTVADRGSPSSKLISPKKSPGCSGSPNPTWVSTDTLPSMTKENESPGVPACVRIVPAPVSTTREMSAIRRSSASEQSVNNGTRRRWLIRASLEDHTARSLVPASSGRRKGKISGRHKGNISSARSGRSIIVPLAL